MEGEDWREPGCKAPASPVTVLSEAPTWATFATYDFAVLPGVLDAHPQLPVFKMWTRTEQKGVSACTGEIREGLAGEET